MKSPRRLRAPRAARRQRGVVLFVALIVLIIMTLAGLALLRQMGVGTSIAGNVAFKENATSVADRGTEAARAWIIANSAITSNDSVANGYLSSWAGSVDPTTFDWDHQSLTLVDDQAQTGNTARIIIQRLCAVANMSALDPAQRCSDSLNDSGASKGGGGYPSGLSGTSSSPFYRVTTRVDGPRNTVSYTQVLMQ
jgi:Tfp pilus assembly protein PilX